MSASKLEKKLSPILTKFMTSTQSEKKFWALQCRKTETWVVVDSPRYEHTEVLPLWSSVEQAKQNCIDEWQDYIPAEISFSQWLESLGKDLSQDKMLVGIDWQDGGLYSEAELADFSAALAQA